MAARGRIRKELEEIKKNPATSWNAGPVDESDLFLWQGAIFGPENTPYEGGIFYLNIRFPSDYPWKPFKIQFITKIYHPHVNRVGGIHCCDYPDLFSNSNDPGNWGPHITVRKAFELLIESLKEIKIHCAGENREVTNMFENNRVQFDITAREWTQKYAS